MREIKLQDLKSKTPTELITFAEELEVENASTMRKQELMFAILKQLAARDVEIIGAGVVEVLQDGFGFYSSLTTPVAQIEGREPKGEHYLLEVDNPMVVPVDTKVRVLITAGDVLHAWWVPAFGVKQDAIPGFVRDSWFRAEKVGVYRGQCAELCGKEHAYMPIHVKVLSKDDYAKWVDGEKKKLAAKADDPNKVWTQPDLMARGEKVYAANCAVCHRPDGKGAGPIKPLDGAAVVLDADHNKQIQIVLNGAANGAMPAWKQLSDTDIAAVVSFTKNSWSNKTGQLVQPAEVLAARGK